MTPLSTPPSRQDPANFASRTDAFLGALPVFVAEATALQVDITNKQAAVASSTTTAAAAAAAALVSANNAAAATGAVLWVSGTAYAAGFAVYSPLTQRTYRRTAAGSGTTDPSLDASNWAAITLDLSAGLPIIRPSLLLNFASSKQVDPRITFNRASSASYFDGLGVMRMAASNEPRIDHDPLTGECKGLLIEGARSNLLLYTELQGTSVAATAITNTAAAPDGTITADTAIEDATNAEHYILDHNTTPVAGTTYTFSAFVKDGPGANRSLYLRVAGGAIAGIYFNPRTKTASSPGGANYVSSGFAELPNGWFRVWVTYTAPSTTTAIHRIQLLDDILNTIYTGNGTSGLYIWGLQCEEGSFPTSYIPSTDSFTSRATVGSFIGSNGLIQSAAINVARVQYNPLNLTLAGKLLLESAATNLLTYSEQFDNAAWASGAATGTIAANAGVAPDGATTADLLEDTDASDIKYYDQITAVPNDTLTRVVSMYVKQGTAARTSLIAYLLGGTAPLDGGYYVDITWATLALNTNCGGHVTSIGNGWYRLDCKIANNGTGNTALYSRIAPAGILGGSAATGSAYAWGAQAELGVYPTSYIATTTTATTRASDLSSSAQTARAADGAQMSGANFSSWYRQDEGSILFCGDLAPGVDAIEQELFSISDSTNANRHYDVRFSDGSVQSVVASGGVSQFGSTTNTGKGAQSIKVASGLQAKNFASSTNGATVQTNTAGIMPVTSMNGLAIGMHHSAVAQLNGHVSCIAYYPKRLTNAELQALAS